MLLKDYLRKICDEKTENGKYYKPDYGDYTAVEKAHFFVPLIHCADGFTVSIQIHHMNYCSSENGYREYGTDWQTAEWGFPSEPDELLRESAETESDICGTVGQANLEILQTLIDKHGGIDWAATDERFI